MIALLDGQHGAQDLIARLSPLGYEGAISDLLTDQVVKLHSHNQGFAVVGRCLLSCNMEVQV